MERKFLWHITVKINKNFANKYPQMQKNYNYFDLTFYYVKTDKHKYVQC